MATNNDIWDSLRYLLKNNFPNDSKEDLEKRFNSLYNYPEDWYGKEIELYVPQFRGIILRIGIHCKGTNKFSYFSTAAEHELDEVLSLDE